MSQIRQKFSKNLKMVREERALTQEQLAEKLDITVRYVQLLEGVRCPNVKIETLASLAAILKVKPGDFLK